MTADPCEYNNIADSRSDLFDEMMARLEAVKLLAVSPAPEVDTCAPVTVFQVGVAFIYNCGDRESSYLIQLGGN